jgi:hypothetical protein
MPIVSNFRGVADGQPRAYALFAFVHRQPESHIEFDQLAHLMQQVPNATPHLAAANLRGGDVHDAHRWVALEKRGVRACVYDVTI